MIDIPSQEKSFVYWGQCQTPLKTRLMCEFVKTYIRILNQGKFLNAPFDPYFSQNVSSKNLSLTCLIRKRCKGQQWYKRRLYSTNKNQTCNFFLEMCIGIRLCYMGANKFSLYFKNMYVRPTLLYGRPTPKKQSDPPYMLYRRQHIFQRRYFEDTKVKETFSGKCVLKETF